VNPILEQIHRHRSVRRFKPDAVPEEALSRVLEAALRASSSGNMQSWSVIVTSDPALKRELFGPHFEQPMAVEAPLLLTFCADFHRMRLWLDQSGAPQNFDNFMSFLIGTIDATLASQNAALAAEAEGLGLCYMGTTLASCRDIARVLQCPDHVVPVVGFALGFPDETGNVRDRLPLAGVVHREIYRDYDPERITSVYRERESAGWKRYMEIPELRCRVEEVGAKNLAQVYTLAKYTRESHVEYSKPFPSCSERPKAASPRRARAP
jgi:nitroreductase